MKTDLLFIGLQRFGFAYSCGFSAFTPYSIWLIPGFSGSSV
jgi:hypothetical protein